MTGISVRSDAKKTVAVKGSKKKVILKLYKFSKRGCTFDEKIKWFRQLRQLNKLVTTSGGRTRRRPRAFKERGIKRVKLQILHFIKLSKIYAFLYRKSTNTCFMDLIGSFLGGMV